MPRSHRDLCIWDGFWGSSPILLILILIILSILSLHKNIYTNILISSLEPVPNAEISPRSLHLGRFLRLQPNIINIINININIINIDITNVKLKWKENAQIYWFQAWDPSQMQRSHRDLCIWDGFWGSSPILLILSILSLNNGIHTNTLISSLDPVPNAEISPRSLHLVRFLRLQPNIINIINTNINININIKLK